MGLPDAAEHLQAAGITVLIYDPRSTGSSNGEPRNDINPFKQIEDISDALTFIASLEYVDSRKVGLWGMSFGGVVALCAASIDKRAKFAIAVCPLTDFDYAPEKRPKVLAKCLKDRESQLMGNPPFYLPMVTDKGENPVGFGAGADVARYAKIAKSGKEIAPNHVNRTTIQSYYRMFMWQPFPLWQHLSPTPVMFVIPKLDTVSPAEAQIRRFDALSCPKELHVEHGVGHEEILGGEHLPTVMRKQIDFIVNTLAAKNV